VAWIASAIPPARTPGGSSAEEVTSSASDRKSVKLALPVRRYLPRRPGRRLVGWVVLGRREHWSFEELPGLVAVEPVLAWLEAADNPMTDLPSVLAGVLRR
jgi:hypothetical protein